MLDQRYDFRDLNDLILVTKEGVVLYLVYHIFTGFYR